MLNINFNQIIEMIEKRKNNAYRKVNEQIVGLVGLNNNYVEGIFVDVNNQHKGIGTALLDKIKEYKESLTLSVYKKNVNAIKFYEKNNFIITGENTNEIEYTMTWKK